MSKRKIIQKPAAILLIITLTLASFLMLPASASNDALYQPQNVLSGEDVPEPLDFDYAFAKGHVARLHGEETELDSAIFQNADGSRSLYVFNENIKYVTPDGKVKDKSNKLKETDVGFCNEDNDIRVVFPQNISSGITLTYGEYTVTLTPKAAERSDTTAAKAGVLASEKGPVIYQNAFGKNTVAQYTPQLSGFKEVIIINEPAYGLSFAFDLIAEGLTVSGSDGAVTLNDTGSGEKVATISQLLMWDSRGNHAVGAYELTKSENDGHYVLRYLIDDFLQDPNTEYPVTIDPSLIVGQGSMTAIEDATIFTNYNSNWGAWRSLFVGDYDQWTLTSNHRGIARTLVKFPGLMSHSTFNTIYNTGIVTSVKYNFSEDWCENGPNTINAYICTAAWDESTVVYSSALWNAIGVYVGNTTIVPVDPIPSPRPRYEIDITLAVKKWKSGTTNNGIIIKSNDETQAAIVINSSRIGDVGGGLSANKPYVVVNYDPIPDTYNGVIHLKNGGVYRLKNVGSNKYLTAHHGFDMKEKLSNDTYRGTNIYQNTDETASNETNYYSQEFKIEYDSTQSACRIHIMCSRAGTYRTLDVKKSGSGISGLTSGCNIQTWTPTDNIAQLFNFVPLGNGQYKIVLKYNTDLAITSYGSGNGSNDGRSATSTGNVFVSTYTGSNNQKWLLEPTVTTYMLNYYGSIELDYPFRGDSIPLKISSGYGYRIHPITNETKMHSGIDIPAEAEVELYSAVNGTVVKIGQELNTSWGRGYYIIIESDYDYHSVYDSSTKLRVIYQHLSEDPNDTNPAVAENVHVTTQTLVGLVGSTGASTGPHLHLGIIIDGGFASGKDHVINPIILDWDVVFTY